jgi:hypothetical protein
MNLCPLSKYIMCKKTFIITGFMFLSLVTTLQARQTLTAAMKEVDFKRVEFGFRFMPTVSAFSMKTYSGGTVKGEATFGYGIGGMLAFNFTEHFGIQGEILYNSLSQKYKDQELDREINVRYLNIPVLFSLNTGKGNPVNLNFVFGPQLGISMGSSIKRTGGTDTDTVTYVLATKNNDIGFAYGAGLGFMMNEIETIRMDIGFRGVYGLMNVNRSTTPKSDDENVYIVESMKIRTAAIYMGISFLF